ncbi:MAG: hypothetical protein ACRD33_00090 [Candidatus Acidiferrales bacterium]
MKKSHKDILLLGAAAAGVYYFFYKAQPQPAPAVSGLGVIHDKRAPGMRRMVNVPRARANGRVFNA